MVYDDEENYVIKHYESNDVSAAVESADQTMKMTLFIFFVSEFSGL